MSSMPYKATFGKRKAEMSETLCGGVTPPYPAGACEEYLEAWELAASEETGRSRKFTAQGPVAGGEERPTQARGSFQ